MKIGDILKLDIADVAFGGDGVARHPGRVVFVPLVLAGERVEAALTGITARFARAECRRVLVPAPARVAPPCPCFGICGGCRYQHADYPLQLQMKRKQVADILQRIGGIAAPPVEALTPSPLACGYRNKLTLHGPGRPGFQRIAGGLLPIERCALANAAINRKLAELADTQLEDGEDLIIRSDPAGEIFMYREYSSRAPNPALEKDTLANGAKIRSGSPQARPPRAVLSRKMEGEAVLSRQQNGKKMLILEPFETIPESLAGISFQVPVRSFFQVNPGVHELLLARVSRLFEEGACANLVDAYCGVGVFALVLAGRAKSVIGIESDLAAVSSAIENAKRLGCPQVRFRQGQVETSLRPALREYASAPTCVILDPPRAGCDDRIIRILLEEHPRQILYLSCAPPVLARDLKRLLAGGYELRRVAPFDMFPQTAHVEVLAELIC